MGVDRSRPGRRRDRHNADPRQRRGLLGWAATGLSHIHGWQGFFRVSTRLNVIAGAIVLLACHPLTERPGQRAHR
jgi:hypothetical protein